ncbi:unnamed protein product [Sympodiomycopsis kandeliae]
MASADRDDVTKVSTSGVLNQQPVADQELDVQKTRAGNHDMIESPVPDAGQPTQFASSRDPQKDAADGDHEASAQHTMTVASEEAAQEVEDDKTAGFNSQTNYVPTSTIITIFLCLSLVTFTIVLDQTTLSVAAPIIGSDLKAGDRVSFLTSSYFLTSTSFQFIYGRVSDFFGRKPLLMVLLVIFFIGSLGSSLSPEIISLVVFRAFTGIAGGGLLTLGQLVIGDVVSLRDRGKYQGILGSVIVLGNGFGPLIGGALAENSSWRNIFRVMLPIIAVAFCVAWKFLPLKKVEGDWKKKARAIDWYGSALSFVAVALVVLGLSWAGSSYPWSDAHVLAPLIIGLVFFIFFVLWQWKGCTPDRPPVMPLGMFRHRIVIGAAITQLANGIIMYSQMYYIPQFYVLAYGYTPIVAGALLLPLLCIQSASSTMSGLIVSKTGRYRELLLSGWAIWAVGLGLFSTLDENSNKGKQIGYALLTGFGVGQTLQIALVALQGAVPRKEMAVVTSLRNFSRSLGGALGLSLGASIVNTVTINDLTPLGWTASQVRQAISNPSDLFSSGNHSSSNPMNQVQLTQLRRAYARGFQIVFILLAAIAAFSFFVTLLLMHQKNIDRDDDKMLKEKAKREIDERKRLRKEQRQLAQSRA